MLDQIVMGIGQWIAYLNCAISNPKLQIWSVLQNLSALVIAVYCVVARNNCDFKTNRINRIWNYRESLANRFVLIGKNGKTTAIIRRRTDDSRIDQVCIGLRIGNILAFRPIYGSVVIPTGIFHIGLILAICAPNCRPENPAAYIGLLKRTARN